MKQMVVKLGDTQTLHFLDAYSPDQLLHIHLRPYKIINPDDGQLKVSQKNLWVLNKELNEMLHRTIINIGKQQLPVCLYDFRIYVQPLYWLWQFRLDHEPDRAEEIRSWFPVFNDSFNDYVADALRQVEDCLEVLSLLYSDFTSSLICFIPQKMPESKSPYDVSAFYSNYIINQKEPETELLEIDGHKRTVYRIFANIKQVYTPLVLTPENLGITGMLQTFPLKVYIQQHALDRLKERVGNYFSDISYILVIESLLERPIHSDNGRLLFPFMNSRSKLGYLSAVITGDKLVVLTFLFITNNGTPEGKRLHDLIGLQKEDKKYLGIDKLSTFIRSDIGQNEKLKDLFCKAGCGALFELSKAGLVQPDQKEILCAAYIARYLGMGQATLAAADSTYPSTSPSF